MPKAYVSATFKDLKEHRRVAQTVLKRFGYDDVAMEYYVAEDQRSADRCLADVAACDLYIGIFAWRYGWQPDGDLSITEMEYRRAAELDKPRLLFLVDEEAAWPMAFVDRDRSHVLDLRDRISKDRMPAFFSTPDTLEARLSAALEKRTTHAPTAIAFDTVGYFRLLRRRYGTLDLDALTDPKRDSFIPLHLASVFVEQNVRDDAPAMELPKEMWQMLAARGELHPDDMPSALTPEQLAELRVAYTHNPARPVLSVLADPANRLTVILGDPGSGKSTLLRYILLTLIDAPSAPRLAPALTARIPLLVELKTYAALRAQNKCDTLLEYFDAVAKSDSSPLTADAVRRLLGSKQPLVVMFDGIDEIFNLAEQETITNQIIAFAEEFADVRVIATSRVIGYRRSLLTAAGFRHVTLQDLDASQVTAFVTQWYTLTLGNRPDEAQQRVERIEKSFNASPSIRQLAGNPMLLTIMAIIGKHQALPRERWKLYDHAADVLVQHWDVHRHLAEPDLMDEEDKKELLRRLAYAMQSGVGGLAGNYIHADMLQQEFEAYLKERYSLPPDRTKVMAKEMIAQFRERNFILSFYGAGLYGFVHRGFLEFFCATAIVDRFQKTKELSLAELKAIFTKHVR